jgi:hypothetical protein
MAEVTRVSGTGFDHGVQYSVANLQGFELDAGTSLAAKDGIGGFIETVVREFQPLMYKSTGTAGKIFMICDGHAVNAASMEDRLQAMGTVDGIATGALTIVARDIDAFDAS